MLSEVNKLLFYFLWICKKYKIPSENDLDLACSCGRPRKYILQNVIKTTKIEIDKQMYGMRMQKHDKNENHIRIRKTTVGITFFPLLHSLDWSCDP